MDAEANVANDHAYLRAVPKFDDLQSPFSAIDAFTLYSRVNSMIRTWNEF